MKTSVLKKSLLDYAIKGHLSAKWRRANPNPNAFDEIESYNAQILKDKKSKEQEFKELESNLKIEKDKETKQALKQKIQNLKKDIAKLKTIVPLTCPLACHSEGDKPEESQRDISAFSKPQYDNVDSCHSEFSSCHSDLECNEREESKRYFANAQYDKDAFIPPFVIPKTWVWVRLGDICESNIGLTYTPQNIKNSGIPVLRSSNIQNGIIDYNDLVYLDEKLQIKESCFVKIGDILMCARNGSSKLVGKVAIIEKERMVFGAFMTIIRSKYNPFLKIYFESAIFRRQLEGVSTTTINQITQDKLKNFLIPLPPLSEQKQIVSILDSLIGLADSFDKTKEELKRIEKRIEKSLLQHAILGKISSKWRRDISALPQYDKIPNAFDEIKSYNAQILKDKKTKEQELKELEVNLKTEKDKEAKQILIQKIQNLKKDIAKLKTIVPLTCPFACHSERSEESKRYFANAQYDKMTSSCHSEALAEESQRDISAFSKPQYDKDSFIPPFAIPKTWAWVRLGEVCEIILGKTPPREIKKYWDKSDYYWVSIGDMQERAIITQTKDCISEIARQECFKDYICKKDTLILSFKLSIGKVSFLGFDGFHNEGIASIIPKIYRDISTFSKPQYDKIALTCHTERSEVSQKEKIFKNFLSYFLPLFTKLSDTTGAIKGETLNKEKLNNLFVALPPLSEQQEIVRTLDTLFALTKGLRVE